MSFQSSFGVVCRCSASGNVSTKSAGNSGAVRGAAALGSSAIFESPFGLALLGLAPVFRQRVLLLLLGSVPGIDIFLIRFEIVNRRVGLELRGVRWIDIFDMPGGAVPLNHTDGRIESAAIDG